MRRNELDGLVNYTEEGAFSFKQKMVFWVVTITSLILNVIVITSLILYVVVITSLIFYHDISRDCISEL